MSLQYLLVGVGNDATGGWVCDADCSRRAGEDAATDGFWWDGDWDVDCTR